ncbi:MAG: DUF1836 domain-containing protein [Christensenellales bacterium]
MENLEQLRELLTSQRPTPWNSLPDLELYMDQVLTYMPRQYGASRKEERLTSSMVNNYIKEGLLPRANGKKYSKEHLAYLTVISMLKQVLSVKDTGFLVGQLASDVGPEEFYQRFASALDAEMSDTAGLIPDELSREKLTEAAMKLAVESYVSKLACERLLDMLSPPSQEKKAK